MAPKSGSLNNQKISLASKRVTHASDACKRRAYVDVSCVKARQSAFSTYKNL